MSDPIFFDPTGRRARRTSMVLIALLLLLLGGAVALAASVATDRVRAPIRFAEDAGRPVAVTPAAAAAAVVEAGPWLPAASAGTRPARREVFGFYMPWDEASRASLAAHGGEIDWLVAGVASLEGTGGRLTVEPAADLKPMLATLPRTVRLMPMVQNALPDGRWDGQGTARLLADPAARRTLVKSLETLVTSRVGRGIMLDLESLPASAHRDYLAFVAELRARFAVRGWIVALAVPAADPAWDLAAYAGAADRLVVMAYDEHWMGGPAGPIASQPWFARTVSNAVAAIGRDKAVVALGSYAYDWANGRTEPLTIAQAWARAARAGTVPVFDRASGNAHFAYRAGGTVHQVWMLDAATTANQLRVLDRLGVGATALWRLGSEDPGFWSALKGERAGAMPALPGVAVRDAGEIMRLDAEAGPGHRRFAVAADGTIRGERYDRLPSADTVQRTGANGRLVALTFDDGPDPAWTPRILDVLKREGAPATFFVTGANALGQGDLLRRIVAEGSEIGNHSASHADLGKRSPAAIRLELKTTERLVEAYTGRSMRLFRPPFLGDADPDRSDELHASRTAAELGYLTVGLNVDPLDWTAPAARAIVQRTIAGVEAGTAAQPHRIVLLHDSGGDRTQTIAALPGIIRGLRARGYEIVTVSRLAGLAGGAAMPILRGVEAQEATGTRALFGGVSGLRDTLGLAFLVAIALGIARALLLTGLALAARRRERRPDAAPHLVPSFVSVLIPAFNEARVIEASVRRILASTGPRIEVIVIDDGSSDDTSAIVARAFGIDPRVRLMTLENGGKARALNRGLAVAKGDIVIALDADTQFEPDTIARLAGWFADPEVGAVAGNARIGNAVNLVTRMQSLEYVTAQNVERRALSLLGAITVVPGAVGAWRRTALDMVGGYPDDTLAEDQDLTLAIQRAGWRVACDNDAVAWTEAPETVRALFKQRFRWAFGTLQCLWKHRGLMGRRGVRGLGMVGLPQALVFQLVLTLIAPVIDLCLLTSLGVTAWKTMDRGWVATGGDALTMAGFWAAFTAIELACGWVAYRLDGREARFPLLRMLGQRFGYRQLLYLVVLRATWAAVRGQAVGWGKLARTGSVAAPIALPVEMEVAPLKKAA